MPEPVGFFLDEDSDECARVRQTLASGAFRCHLMMVVDAGQAAAMLRQECQDSAPDLLLVYGGVHDGRAAALLEKIAQDARLRPIRFRVLVDNAQAFEQLRRQPANAGQLGVFKLAAVSPRLERQDQRFWWVMARFS